ncbi:MAG: hypothetical protein DHS20C15_18100 [Planctomycetota bacterium]|nr:MAG: hypothetical protein DHS20C15_18100 [Planctomycetota bacterium]
MNNMFKALIVAGVLAMVVIVIQNNARESELDAWRARTAARTAEQNTEALEEALSSASGSPASAFISYDLAQAYLTEGEPADLERAIQVAEAAIEEDPGEPLSSWLQRVADSARSFQN